MEEKEHRVVIYLTTEELREIVEWGRLVEFTEGTVKHKPGDHLALRIYQAYLSVLETPEESN